MVSKKVKGDFVLHYFLKPKIMIKNVYDAEEAERRDKLLIYEQQELERKEEEELQEKRRRRRRRKPFYRI